MKYIYSNIKDSDALESFCGFIASFNINSEGEAYITACYVNYLKPNNIDYSLIFISNAD